MKIIMICKLNLDQTHDTDNVCACVCVFFFPHHLLEISKRKLFLVHRYKLLQQT